jgi:MFS transporter, ACS family, solute carrier family 17 (sodium-dependent inorganic phosphate cotransporter), other
MMGPAACMLLVTAPDVGSSSASALITAALGLNALTLGAVSVSQLDIAPRHAGAVFGIGNTCGTLSGFLSTQVTGTILGASGSWALVFTIAAAHFAFGAVMWYLWVGDEPLPEDKLS